MHAKRRRQHYIAIHSTFNGTLCYFVFIEKVAWRAYTFKHKHWTYRMIHQACSSLSFLYFNHSNYFKLIQTVVFEIVWYIDKDYIHNFLKKKNYACYCILYTPSLYKQILFRWETLFTALNFWVVDSFYNVYVSEYRTSCF